MRISRLKIDGFGHFRDLDLELGPGLNLVSGPNEAGKSTLMAFVRAVLFGFERRDRPERYEPASGPFGGELWLETAGGPLIVRRQGGKKVEGEVTLRGPRGEPLSPSRLAEALGGMPRALYYEVFAFGLDELASFEQLAKEGTVSDALFAAGMQGATRLPVALETLRKRAEALYTVRGAKRELNQRMGELEEVQQELRNLGDRPARYAERVARRDEVDRGVAAAEQACSALRTSEAEARRLVSAVAELNEHRVLAAELAALPELTDFPEDAVARLDARVEALASARREAEQVEAEHARWSSALERVSAALPVEAAETRARAALERFDRLHPLVTALPARRAAVEERLRRAEATIAGLGLDGVPEDAALGAAARAELAGVRDAADRAQTVATERAAAVRAATGEAERCAQELSRLDAELSGLCETPVEDLRRRLGALAKVAPLSAELRSLDETRRDRQARLEALASGDEPAPRRAFPAGVLAVLATVLAAAAAMAWWRLGVEAGAIASGVAATVIGLLGFLHARASAAHREACATVTARNAGRGRERAALTAELAALTDRVEAVRGALGSARLEAGCGVADPGELAELETELQESLRQAQDRRRLTDLRPERAQRLAAALQGRAEAEAAGARALEAVRTHQEAIAAWLAARGLPQGLTPERALELCAALVQARERRDEARAELAAIGLDEATVAASHAELDAVCAAAGVTGAGSGQRAAALRTALEQAQERRRQRAQAQGELAAIASRREARAAAVRRAEEALKALLASAGCETEDALRSRAALAQRHRVLRTKVAGLAQSVAARTGLEPARAGEALEVLGGAEAAAERAEALRRELDARETARAELLKEQGALHRELEELERDGEVQALRAREEALKLRVAALAEAYAVEKVALTLLTQARRAHEEEHQPRLLQLASEVFRTLTGGRFLHVRARQEEQSLHAIDAQGEAWDAERLSRGTREQLYLAFRMAVIQDTSARLPVLVDDVLVNFDPVRAKAACEALAALSQRQQVLAFTCHPHMAALLTGAGARTVEFTARPSRAVG